MRRTRAGRSICENRTCEGDMSSLEWTFAGATVGRQRVAIDRRVRSGKGSERRSSGRHTSPFQHPGKQPVSNACRGDAAALIVQASKTSRRRNAQRKFIMNEATKAFPAAPPAPARPAPVAANRPPGKWPAPAARSANVALLAPAPRLESSRLRCRDVVVVPQATRTICDSIPRSVDVGSCLPTQNV